MVFITGHTAIRHTRPPQHTIECQSISMAYGVTSQARRESFWLAGVGAGGCAVSMHHMGVEISLHLFRQHNELQLVVCAKSTPTLENLV